jgi:D-arabinose 1-dehydrogenase-like Zn-dependent alcohol dehydrogenase
VEAAPLACSGVTAYSALKKVDGTLKDEAVVIIGAGGVGLMGVTLAQKMGAKDVDHRRHRCGQARGRAEGRRDQGDRRQRAPTPCSRSRPRPAAAPGRVSISSAPSATVNLAVNSTSRAARSSWSASSAATSRSRRRICRCARMTVRGSYVGSQTDMAELLDLVKRTGMPPVPIKTRPLEEVNATLNDLRAGKIVGRVVLTPAA